jgi:hypothetical protein
MTSQLAKLSCWQESQAQCWTIVLYFTMVFNLNYGPFGKGAWFADKQEWLQHFLADHDQNSPQFVKYAGKIAQAHSWLR